MTRGLNTSTYKSRIGLTTKVSILIAIIISITAWLCFHFYYSSPARVFSRMFNNSLSTAGYSKIITNTQSGQSVKQVLNVQTGAVNRVVESQTISVPGYPEGTVKLLSIGTPTTDYSKYTQINTKAKSKTGQTVNYSSVLGVWGENSPSGTKINGGQLFTQSVLDVVPIANVNPALKKQYLDYLRKYNVYSYSGNVKTQKINGRKVYAYTVSIRLYYLDYYLYQFSRGIGISHDKIQAIDKKPTTNAIKKIQFDIDVASGQLAEIYFTGTKEKYVYSSFGATPQIAIPKKTIPLSTLENNIQNLINK